MPSTPFLDQRWLEKLNQIILDNIANPDFNNFLVAQELGISESTLHRKIVRITDKTPLTYIRQCRLQQAKILLETGEYDTVKSVAIALGFLKVNYFSQRYLPFLENDQALF